MHDIPFDLLLGLASLVYVFTNFVSNVTAKQWSSVEKQVLAWAVGIGALTLGAHTDFAGGTTVAGQALNKLNWASLVFLGLLPPSFGGVLYHLGQRFDNNGTGTVPDLPAPPAPPVPSAVPALDVAQGEPLQIAQPPEPQVINLQPVVHVHVPEPKPAPARRTGGRTRKAAGS